MLSVAVYFASGAAFFTGAACLLAGLFMPNYARRNFARPIGRFLLLLGIFQVIMSATPLPAWAYAIWGLSFLLWIVAIIRRKTAGPSWPTTMLAACVSIGKKG